jgi:hypothetical protein
MNNLSTFLTSRPTTIEGISRLFDSSGALSNRIYTNLDSELIYYLALYSDWKVVGDDLKVALLNYLEELSSDNSSETK